MKLLLLDSAQTTNVKPNLISDHKPLLKPTGRWAIAALSLAALAVVGVTARHVIRLKPNTSSSTAPTPQVAPVRAVSALGRLQPEGEVISLSPPTAVSGLGSSRVDALLVQEGDLIEAGQVVAILDTHQNLQAALELASEDVSVARARLAQVEAGTQTGQLEAQQAAIANLEAERDGQLRAQEQAIARLETELNHAQVENQRYQELYQDGAVAASQRDSQQLVLARAQEQLNEAQTQLNRIETTFQQRIREARATLSQLAEVRPTDVGAAQAEVDRAIAHTAKARADLELALVRAPTAGQVLKIHTRPGETVGDRGIVALGQTQQMQVIAEVYESDIGYVQPGQSATITSRAFPGSLQGTVNQVGLQINPQEILSTDPTADVNRRIVEVKIRLDPAASEQVTGLTNLQVNVVINI